MSPLKSFHGQWWKEYVERRVTPRFKKFGELTRTRVMRGFEDIDREATELEARRRKELIESIEVHDGFDPSEGYEAMAEMAFEEASEFHVMLSQMRFATRNLHAGALYHMFEQHLIDLRAQILDDDSLGEIKVGQVVGWFEKALGLKVKELDGWSVVDELRLVANVVKHAEGDSAAKLRAVRPALFVYPSLRKGKPDPPLLRLRTTLFGAEIFLSEEDFTRYYDGVVAFWTALAAALPPLTK